MKTGLVTALTIVIFLSGCAESARERATDLANEGSYPFSEYQLEHGLYVANDVLPTLIIEVNGTTQKSLLEGDYLAVSQDFKKQKAAFLERMSSVERNKSIIQKQIDSQMKPMDDAIKKGDL